MKISLIGLSGSGKTCYLYTVSHVLSKGIKVNGHVISARSSNEQQLLRLNRGIETMCSGIWPEGSINTMTYPYELMIDGFPVFPFTIYDYRGGMLNGLNDSDQDDREEIYETFQDSSCIIILVDGDTIIKAMDPDLLPPAHRNKYSMVNQLRARNELNYIEMLIKNCSKNINRNLPVLLAITKRDIFLPNELEEGKKLLKELLPCVFSKRNDFIVGITSVTIGENLRNEEGKLFGTLCLNTEGNVHLPVLFALFQEISSIGGDENTEEARLLIQKLFSTGKINFYRGGKPAFIV